MKISVVSLKKSALTNESCDEVRLPTQSGRITLLPGHTSLLSALIPGLLHVHLSSGVKKVWALGGGVVRMENDEILVIADMVEEGVALSAEELKDRKETAKKHLSQLRSGEKESTMDEILEAENAYLKVGALERLYRHSEK